MSTRAATEIEWRLPPHAAEALALFAFPHGADDSDSVWVRTYDDGSIVLMAQCSDTFAYATADAEPITEEDMPLLRRCFADLYDSDERYLLSALFSSRKRGLRPMDLFFKDVQESEVLFPAASTSLIAGSWILDDEGER